MINLNGIPPISPKNLAIQVTKQAQKKMRQGHPWLFDGGIVNESFAGKSGDIAILFDQKRKFLSVGLYDPDSPIRVKMLASGKPTKIDGDWFKQKIAEAAAKRQPIADSGTTGYRIVYGEGDFLPGLIVDRYGDTLVIKIYSAAWFPHLADILAGLDEIVPSVCQILRLSRNVQAGETWGLKDGAVLKGELPDAPVPFIENELKFAADVVQGHKTGFFFDHRDNRQQVGKLARNKRVLDVFAYTGGFSLYAAAGGAKSVISLDISQPALDAALDNFELNDDRQEVLECEHETIAADAFNVLDDMANDRRKFDLVIVDPPSFAKSQAEIAGAVKAYAKLTRAALKVLSPQGTLVMASCSSRVSADLFFDTVVAAAAETGRKLWEQSRSGHPIDHTVRPEFPEGNYLKCGFFSVID
ncbi:MAG: class I SAM-dependent rRNA methyltransferase [Anaerolineae bacterium]